MTPTANLTVDADSVTFRVAVGQLLVGDEEAESGGGFFLNDPLDSALGYDLRHLAAFLDGQRLDWNDFRPSTALEFLGYLRRMPSARAAQRLGLTVATEHGRLLSPATVQRALAAASSFFDWAIAAEQYTTGDNPMQRRVDHALGRVPERRRPFVGAASRQQPVRRTVRVRLPLRLPRPMSSQDIDALLTSITTLRD